MSKSKYSEYELQKAVVDFIKLQYPKMLYCGSAGGVRTSMSQAKKMKATGYIKGFPDLFIYEPRGKYSGLAIELKVKGNYPSKEQKEWIERLKMRGYQAKVCTGFEECIQTIQNYLRC